MKSNLQRTEYKVQTAKIQVSYQIKSSLWRGKKKPPYFGGIQADPIPSRMRGFRICIIEKRSRTVIQSHVVDRLPPSPNSKKIKNRIKNQISRSKRSN